MSNGDLDAILSHEDPFGPWAITTEETIMSGDEPQIRTHDFEIRPDHYQRPGILTLALSRIAPGGGWYTGSDIDMRTADLLALRETIDRYLDTETPCGGCSGGFTYRYGGDPPEARRWIPHGDECVFWLADDERTDQERGRDQ